MSEPAETRTPRFQMVAQSEEEENAYDIVATRNVPKPCSVFASVMHIVKGALGGGILGGHVAYKKAGVGAAIPLTIALGAYMGWCLHLLVWSTQRLCRRTRVSSMSYSDVGEAAFTCFPKPIFKRLAKVYRYMIDGIIMMDLFGSCACYQIIISKTAKQLVENVQETTITGYGKYPHLRVYLIIVLVPIILICLIRHLKWLAPFSMVANALIFFCLFVTIYYAFENNPRCENLVLVKNVEGVFQMIGMIVYSLSCAGVVIPIENNMKTPTKFPVALAIGMSINTFLLANISFFGYMGYLEKSDAPLTINIPMTLTPKIIKGAMAAMIYATHALNFWVPFNLCWWYLQRMHKGKNLVKWELIYRAIIVTIINFVAIIFPSITALMGFIGAFCISNMAFIWPQCIFLTTVWYRPGLGPYKWRFFLAMFLLIIGIFLLVLGSIFNIANLVSVFVAVNINKSK